MILITGSTGFVGRNLIDKISGKEKVKCLVRKNSNIKFLKEHDVQLVYGDITDKKSLDNALKGIDIVIHLAALINGTKEQLYNVNIEGTKNLIALCRKNKVKRIIALSSMAATRKHLDNYGKSKQESENLIKDSGLDYTILRPTMIYGKGSNSIKNIANYIKKIPLIIPVIGDGEIKIQPVDVNDVVSVIIKSLDNKKSINKTYNLLGGTRISLDYFIDFVSSHLRIRKLKIHVPIILVLVGIKFFSVFYRNFPVSQEFIKDMNQDTINDNKETEQDFNIKFKKLSQSFQL